MIIDIHGHYTTAPASLQACTDRILKRTAQGNGTH
jgi:hypothetical protein